MPRIEDQIKERLEQPMTAAEICITGVMDLRSLLSSAAIELRSLRELCKQQRKRIDELTEDVEASAWRDYA